MTTFLDTNVLVYAQGPGPKGDIARDALLAGGTVSVQILNEFASVLRRKFRLEWPGISAALDDVRAVVDQVVPLTLETHETALSIARETGFGFYDALVVAAASRSGCDLLLTEDLQAGRRVRGTLIVNPFA